MNLCKIKTCYTTKSNTNVTTGIGTFYLRINDSSYRLFYQQMWEPQRNKALPSLCCEEQLNV